MELLTDNCDFIPSLCYAANSILARKARKSKPLTAPAFGTTSITPFFSSPSYGSIQSPFGVQNSTFGKHDFCVPFYIVF
jgi:hypothetical protein